jgi:hypothetical protein
LIMLKLLAAHTPILLLLVPCNCSLRIFLIISPAGREGGGQGTQTWGLHWDLSFERVGEKDSCASAQL